MAYAKFARIIALALISFGLSSASFAQKASAPPVPPAQTNCTVSSSTFTKQWQQNGAFVAPNSAAFSVSSQNGNCSFYQWSAQMFLWLTNKDSNGHMNFLSSSFYTYDGANSSFVPNSKAGGDGTVKVKLRMSKPRNSLTFVFPGAVDGTAQAGSNGIMVSDGAPIANPGKSGTFTYPLVYYAVNVNDVYAGLVTQYQLNSGANVPYFYNGIGSFPLSTENANEIAKANATTYADANALALEVKSSWIDTAYLPAGTAGNYLTINAQVPAFAPNQTTPATAWTWDGSTMATRQLALVGLHVVGSVAGHPEMIWATFEQVNNSPDANYYFVGNDGKVYQCPTLTNCLSVPSAAHTGVYTFNNPADQSAQNPPNTQTGLTTANKGASVTLTACPPAPQIMANPCPASQTQGAFDTGTFIQPTVAVRTYPWGNAQATTTPKVNDPVVQNNTLLLSLNQSIAADAGAAAGCSSSAVAASCYFQVGAVWTGGFIPISQMAGIGSQWLANTTMETFIYTVANTGNPAPQPPNNSQTNCFFCHAPFGGATQVSHIFPPNP